MTDEQTTTCCSQVAHRTSEENIHGGTVFWIGLILALGIAVLIKRLEGW